MLRYTLRQLEYATAIADHGSVAAAAAGLGVAQPSLSTALKKLEAQLGLQLFIRQHAQGLTPTVQGARVIAEARSLLGHAREFQRASGAAGTEIEGTIAIGSFLTLAAAFAPRLIAGFQSAFPRTTLKLEEGVQDQLYEGLRSGRHDLALLYSVDPPADIRCVSLARLSPYVLLPARHRLARQKSVSLRDLASEPFVMLDIEPSRTYFMRIIESQGIAPRIAFASPSLELVRGLVGQGLGYSLLVTRPSGDRTYDGERVMARAIAEDVEPGIIAAATLRQLRPTRLVSTFEAFCVQYFHSLRVETT